ncbi:MAG: gephyrin-like molybdotransferase Glp [Thioalkalivibrionaceae bacterium]
MTHLCDEFDPNATEIDHGIARVIERAQALRSNQTLPPEAVTVQAALGRVLAAPVHAKLDVPMTDISAMDGFGLPASEDTPETRLQYRTVGTAAAGRPFTGRIRPGEAVRILTGAVIPHGVDRVVVEEVVEHDGDQLFAPLPKAGDNIRRAGEDTHTGQVLFDAGTRVTPLTIGVLASQGITSVNVVPILKVGIVSTGDEVVESGKPLSLGQLYDSNRQLLTALLSREPVECVDFGIVPDNAETIERTLTRASESCHLVIATGGASFGDFDFVNRLLAERGEVTFWKLAFKPGRPFACGRFGRAMFFGLPGNPVAVATTYSLLVRPALDVFAGTAPRQPRGVHARLAAATSKRAGRTDYQRAILERDDSVAVDDPIRFKVTTITGQGSHQLHAMAVANAYAILPRMSEGLAEGEVVEVIPFDELGLTYGGPL